MEQSREQYDNAVCFYDTPGISQQELFSAKRWCLLGRGKTLLTDLEVLVCLIPGLWDSVFVYAFTFSFSPCPIPNSFSLIFKNSFLYIVQNAVWWLISSIQLCESFQLSLNTSHLTFFFFSLLACLGHAGIGFIISSSSLPELLYNVFTTFKI